MQHITADITFLTEVAEPKTCGVKSGYAPHHKFPNIDWLASGFHQYSDESLHFPGETIEAKICFVSWEYLRDAVSVGVRFEVRELDRLIGIGVVTSIANE
jgi:translation elongation factor EF-Tu-like GTPase